MFKELYAVFIMCTYIVQAVFLNYFDCVLNDMN